MIFRVNPAKSLFLNVFFLLKLDTILNMYQKSYLLNLLNASIICLLAALYSSKVIAATWAVVTSERAIIYSDVEMTSKLGYVRKGKKVRVGTVAKNQGQVVPIVVNKRIAYIQLKDLRTVERIDTLKNVISRITKKMDEKQESKRIGIAAGFHYPLFSTDTELDNPFDTSGLFFTLGLRGYYQSFKKESAYKFSLDYNQSNFDGGTMSWISVPIGFHLQKMQLGARSFDIYVGPLLLPYVEIEESSGLYTLVGQGLGAEASAEYLIPLNLSTNLHLEAAVHAVKLFNLDLLGAEVNPFFVGLKFMATLSYEY